MSGGGVWTKGFLSVGGTDLSAYVRSLAISEDIEAQDNTSMGDTFRSATPGLKSFAVEAELNQSSSSVDAIIAAVLGSTTAVIVRRSSTGAQAAGNPQWSGSMLVTSYTPHQGAVGDVDSCTVSFVGAGTVTRSIST